MQLYGHQMQFCRGFGRPDTALLVWAKKLHVILVV